MQDEAIEVALDKNNKLAQALHITGTPGFVVGDEITSGAKYFDALQALITKARSANQATSCEPLSLESAERFQAPMEAA